MYPFMHGTFYNCASDDVVQYYPFVAGFFERIKTGTLSLYDTSLFGGASFFASTYYIPIDLFLVLAFILSFIMSVERAYFLTIVLKMICGGLLMFYVLKRKNIKPLVCMIIGAVYMVTGLTESYIIFPVYLGINVYVPIAILLVDLFFNKDTKWYTYYLLPLFVLNLVLFDFYCAYMILAFMSFYFLIESHLRSEKFFLVRKDFWINFLKFFGYVIVGVMISAAILIPSAYYILHQSNRTGSTTDYFWYFSSDHYTNSGLAWRHYFTQFINLFITNNPAKLCLVSAGDYVREHATLYMTSGVLLYFVKFLFTNDKKFNRLKFWVILFNIMYLIPVFSMIFTLSNQAYVRWFFMPYTLNIMAAAMMMDKCNFKFNKNRVGNYFAYATLLLGFGLVLYTFINNPSVFIHYDRDSQNSTATYFNYILIGAAIALALYIVILLIPIVGKFFKKNLDVAYKAIPLVVLFELIFSVAIIVSSLGVTSYSTQYATTSQRIKYLRQQYGYNFNDGYRINLYTNEKCIANNNTMFLNVNCTNFFQSFYNTPLNVYYSDIHGQTETSWSRRSIYGYSLLNAPMYNNKYIISNSQTISTAYFIEGETEYFKPLQLPEAYYTKLGNKYNANYYETKDLPQFIVYDSLVYKNAKSTVNNNSFYNDLALLKYGYAKMPDGVYSLTYGSTVDDVMSSYSSIKADLDGDDLEYLENLKKLYDAGLNFKTMSTVYDEIIDTQGSDYDMITLSSSGYSSYNNYYEYDLTYLVDNDVFKHDALYVYPYDSKVVKCDISNTSRVWFYLRDSEDNKLYPLHYNVGYLNGVYNENNNQISPETMYMYAQSSATSSYVKIFGFDYSIYDDYLSRQNEYTNREFSINGSTIHLAFDNDGNTKVVKLPYAYSDEWQIKNSDGTLYQTVNIDGGFLGIIVPDLTYDVDITVEYVPEGITLGLKISLIGSIIYMTITTLCMSIDTKKKIERITLCKQYH